MLLQDTIEAHASTILSAASTLVSRLSSPVDEVIAAVSAYVAKNTSRVNDAVERSPDNAKAILEVENIFTDALGTSDYYLMLYAFVSSFIDQVDAFEAMYSEMATDLSLPAMSLTDEDMDILANQGAAALAVLEGQVLRVNVDLRQFLARSLGESEIDTLVKGASDIIRRVTDVEPIAKDQLILFFRLVGNLVYRRIETSGMTLRYAYAGRKSKGSRGFCATMLDGRSHLMSDIAKMDNRQVANVFDNCGGYGCMHWWQIAGIQH